MIHVLMYFGQYADAVEEMSAMFYLLQGNLHTCTSLNACLVKN